MNFFSFVNQYADQVGGQYTEYDATKSIVVIPVADGRFQTILMLLENTKASGKQRGIITSKVCDYSININLRELLEQNAKFDYSKFIIDAGHIKVEATFLTDGTSEDEVKHMIQEVANLADEYEMKLTGRDIH